MSYKHLIAGTTKDIWETAMCKELGRLSNGYKDLTGGTNTVEFLKPNKINNILKHKTITYARITADYREQKKDPYRIRITVGGNLIKYDGPTTSTTAELATSKLMWNSVISTPNSRYICIDIKNFYLKTPMKDPEYMKIKATLVPKQFIDEYKLQDHIHNEYIYLKIIRGMYGLP